VKKKVRRTSILYDGEHLIKSHPSSQGMSTIAQEVKEVVVMARNAKIVEMRHPILSTF